MTAPGVVIEPGGAGGLLCNQPLQSCAGLMDWVELCWGIKCVLGDWCRKMMRIWNLLWGWSCSAPPGFGHNMCLVKDRELFRLWVSSSVVFSINKKMVLWGLDGSISLTKVKSWCLGSCFRWGNSPHSTHLPQAQRCQKGLWKSTDGSNYIDNLPFPEAEKSIYHWQDSDKFLWKSKRNQYSLCDRNSCEDFLGFHSFPLLFFFPSSSKQCGWKYCEEEKWEEH